MVRYRFALSIGFAALLAFAFAGPAAASHAVRNAGDGTIKGTFWIDFDAGMLNTRINANKDVQFEVVAPTDRFLHPAAAPAGILKMGSSEPSYSTCSHASLVTQDYDVKDAVTKWFCFKTSEGRYVRFQVNGKKPYPGGVHITWTTWEL